MSERCCFVGDLLGAAPTKAAALIAFLPLAAAALFMTCTFGLALAIGAGDRTQGKRVRSNEIGCLAGVDATNQAAVELQVSFVLLL